jgi:hypothetical protein
MNHERFTGNVNGVTCFVIPMKNNKEEIAGYGANGPLVEFHAKMV